MISLSRIYKFYFRFTPNKNSSFSPPFTTYPSAHFSLLHLWCLYSCVAFIRLLPHPSPMSESAICPVPYWRHLPYPASRWQDQLGPAWLILLCLEGSVKIKEWQREKPKIQKKSQRHRIELGGHLANPVILPCVHFSWALSTPIQRGGGKAKGFFTKIQRIDKAVTFLNTQSIK